MPNFVLKIIWACRQLAEKPSEKEITIWQVGVASSAIIAGANSYYRMEKTQ